jgi:hypothetical protein
MPFLKDIIGETYVPKPNDEKRFVEKHVVKLFQNMYADSEYDKLFKATNISTVRRSKERHGYDVGNNVGDGSGVDAKVYEEKEINESKPNYRLADTLHYAAQHHAKNDLESKGIKMGQVAHAIAATAHEMQKKNKNVNLQMIFHAISNNSKGFPLGRKVRNEILSRVEKHQKSGKYFDPRKQPYGKKGGFLADSYIMKMDDQLWENCADSDMHWDAIEHVAKKHGVPKEMVAGSLLGNFMNMTDGDFASKRFRRDFHNYIEDKKAGIHEHSDGQSSEQVLLQHEEGECQEEITRESKTSRSVSGSSGGGSDSTGVDRGSFEEDTEVEEAKSSEEKAKDVENMMNNYVSSSKSKAKAKLLARKKTKVDEEVVNEKLAADASAKDYIKDFVKSDDPRFKGDSKKKRIDRALAAYYSKKGNK